MKARLALVACLMGSIAGCEAHTGATSASGGSSDGGAVNDASAGSSGALSSVPTNVAGESSNGGTASNASAGSSGGLSAVPTNHRPNDVTCPQERGPGSASVVDECSQDAECTQGINGRCISPNVVGPFGGSRCSYDQCFSDADCPANQPCKCRESAALNLPNICIAGGNCRIDSDCGLDGFCSPSLFYIDSSIDATSSSGSGFATFGYFCHTSKDRCRNDSDCDASNCRPAAGCGFMACGYSTDDRWDCFRVGTH